ncbi:hypothetical protein F5Y13DRAFT_10293 [Hypoxylon sp. FL1857]|nr:hypothetical protein F5Y13DRAFT_10293 [Hypoxylon sp. FL1857]
MEAASPPKRMTRARAAAKEKDATAATTATTKSTTKPTAKSAKAAPAPTTKPAATTTTTTRTAKRKTRSDENEDEDGQTDGEHQGAMNKPARTRGRPKKVADTKPDPEPEPSVEDDTTTTTATRGTRGRAKKATTTTATAPKEEPAKNTRARASARTRKTATEDSSAETPAEPVKKTTRSRGTKAAAGVITTTVSTEPTPGLKSAVSRPASRIGGAAVKKTVTFQEPEKENLLPAAPIKAKSKTSEPATGMRAKPVRKPAASGRTTRASAKTATTSEKRDKSPLSPKKDAQNLSLSRDADSDDELATLEKTPLKPLMKSPVKPPSMAKKHELQPASKDANDVDEHDGDASEPAAPSVLGSPARRPPSSPFKDAMKSPAKKVEAIPLLVQSSKDDQTVQAPLKTSMLQSPAKRPQLPIKSLQPPSQESGDIARSPVKMSLLQSPAKRPTSPFKLQGPPMQSLGSVATNLFAPKTSPVEEKQPIEEVQQPTEEPESMETENDDELALGEQQEEGEVQLESPSQLTFPGRLSAVLPRHADPALRDNPLPMKGIEMAQLDPAASQPVEVQQEPTVEAPANEAADDPMDIDEVEPKEEEASDAPAATVTTPPQSPPKQAINPAFGLRAKDLDDQYMDESEDELAGSGKSPTRDQDDTTLSFSAVPATPTPSTLKTPRGMPSSAVKAASRAIRSVSKGSRFGFTPLASQLSDWKASSPTKKSVEARVASPEFKDEGFSLLKENDTAPAESTPSRSFFDEEMRIRAEMENQAAMEAALEAEIEAAYGDGIPEFDDIPITDEDVELAAEANEMSLLESANDDSISEASQEYGDENAVPIDPALLASNGGARRLEPTTPTRPPTQRSFYTTSKVPLKPADDSTPGIKKRCASASKLPPANRPTGLFRNATVISYSPTKDSNEMDIDEDEEPAYPPVTPSKSEMWSSMGTPARTPRRDLNTSLLRGAVIFVDVHTSEGADASTIFVELLTQMGARCVKSWPWNPAGPTNGDGSSKVGITHVVYKDGGKRTLEKVRETGGVVQCVGVGWVLDCERENQWLDEAPYYVDTSLVPRGGHKRRKSMEPKALANLNGTLVTPMKPIAGPGRDCQTVPNNHISRRDSTAWMHTPSDHDENEDAPYEHDWEKDLSMLSPMPKTPAPQDVARYAMDVTPDTPSTVADAENELEKEELLMRTCPPKSAYADLGNGFLKKEKDQGILMRLMAARRKSLQFAPKIASPLSKAWN